MSWSELLSVATYVWSHHMTSFHSRVHSDKTTPHLCAFSLWFYFSHILTFSLCPFLIQTHRHYNSATLSVNPVNLCWTLAIWHHVSFPSAAQRLEVREQGCSCRHGIWKYEQWGGAKPEGVWAVCAETQHSTAVEGLHCSAVHLQARQANGLPQGVLREAGEGLCVRLSILVVIFDQWTKNNVQ